MAGPEIPRGPAEGDEKLPSQRLAENIAQLKKIQGTQKEPIPKDANETTLKGLQEKNSQKAKFDDFREMYRNNELYFRRGALQRQAKIDEPGMREELVINDQAATYYEYMPKVIDNVISVMDRYQALKAKVKVMPEGFVVREQKATEYIGKMNGLMSERLAFANLIMIDNELRVHPDNGAVLMKMREEAAKELTKYPKSMEAFNKPSERAKRANELDQTLIDHLGGKNVPNLKDVLPQFMYLDLLEAQYKDTLERQKQIARDPELTKTQVRHDKLAKKNEDAKNGGPALDPLEAAEFNSMKTILADRNVAFAKLGEERRALTQDMVALTKELGMYQIQMAELTTTQNLFNKTRELEWVVTGNMRVSSPELKSAVTKTMQERRDFHVERLNGFMKAVDKDVLNVGAMELTEDFWNKNGREGLRIFSNTVAKMFTALVPETLGLRERAMGALAGPLNDALGWPPGKEKWSELTPEEKTKVQDKAKSVRDAVKEFDRSTIDNFKSSMDLLKSMPKPETLVDKDVKNPLPTDVVTAANKDALITQHGAATVYLMIFRQMDAQWGNDNPPSGFMGEYAKFFGKIDKNIDVHLDVGKALYEQKQAYQDLTKYLLYAILAALAAPAAVWAYKEYRASRMKSELSGLRSRTEQLETQLKTERNARAKADQKNTKAMGEMDARIKGLETDLQTADEQIKALEAENAQLEADAKVEAKPTAPSGRLGKGPAAAPTGDTGAKTGPSGELGKTGEVADKTNIDPKTGDVKKDQNGGSDVKKK